MSFFHDDFYSTKASRWGRSGWNGNRRDRRRLLVVALASACVGAALVLFLLPVFHRGGTSARTSAGGEDPVVQAADKVRTAVVSVISTFQATDQQKSQGVGIGSGVIFQKAGSKALIVTNDHVVDGGASFEAVLSDGSKRKAEVVGMDQYSDLAVLAIDGSGVNTIAQFGDSDKVQPGEKAIAIGSPLGLSQTITVGVISAKQTLADPFSESDYDMDVIQTDAAINQGNSGGALINLDGKVIGINSMKIAQTGVEGLGFAIPINQAKPILEELIKYHQVKRAYMGITPTDLQSYEGAQDVLKLPASVKNGVIVLEAAGPAKEAGLQSQDVIVQLDGKDIPSSGALRKYLYTEKKIGDKLAVTYYRNGKKATVTMTLGELPAK